MTEYFALLAQLDGLNPLNPTAPVSRNTGLVVKDFLVIIATGLALGLLLLFWARYYVRKTRRRHHHERQPLAHSVSTGSDPGDEEPHHHSRRRRRRREHRPRNPTLAETGGMPATRTEPSSNPPL